MKAVSSSISGFQEKGNAFGARRIRRLVLIDLSRERSGSPITNNLCNEILMKVEIRSPNAEARPEYPQFQIDQEYLASITRFHKNQLLAHPVLNRTEPLNARTLPGFISNSLYLVENRKFVAPCPMTGERLEAICGYIGRTSMPSAPYIFYEFYSESCGVFYIILGQEFCSPMGLYFPKDLFGEELLLFLEGSVPNEGRIADIQRAINEDLKKSNKSGLFSRELKPSKVKICLVVGGTKNFGHAFWNEVSGLDLLNRYNLLDQIEHIFVGPYFPLDRASETWLLSSRAQYFSSFEELCSDVNDNNYIPIRFIDFTLSKPLINKLKQTASSLSGTSISTREKRRKNAIDSNVSRRMERRCR